MDIELTLILIIINPVTLFFFLQRFYIFNNLLPQQCAASDHLNLLEKSSSLKIIQSKN